MSKGFWIVTGAAATLYLLHRRQMAAAVAAPPATTAPADPGFSADIDQPFSGGVVYQQDTPSTPQVSPADGRGDGTNPGAAWLQRVFGITLPQVGGGSAYLANASAPMVAAKPMNPAGDYTDSNLGQPAVPGTYPPDTSSPPLPADASLADPALLASVMPYSDEYVYVADPVLGL